MDRERLLKVFSQMTAGILAGIGTAHVSKLGISQAEVDTVGKMTMEELANTLRKVEAPKLPPG